MQEITLNKNTYFCNLNDYEEYKHKEYNNLKLFPIVGKLERYIGLLNDLCEILIQPTLMIYGAKYSSFVANEVKNFDKVYILRQNGFSTQDIEHVEKNIEIQKIKALLVDKIISTSVLFILENNPINLNKLEDYPIILSPTTILNIDLLNYKVFLLSSSPYQLMVHHSLLDKFNQEFKYYIDSKHLNLLNYDNMINLCIMVKNGGKEFEKMLETNLPIIDRYTILDTGSTDGTVENAKRILANKKGKIYEEPFINFRESRNRCLDLAGTFCKYNIMLDDTYCLGGNLREFLETIRSDQFADSYSLLIKSGDVEYYSNRITKSKNHLRYIFILHEVIQQKNNINVVVPSNVAWIDDLRSESMEIRTNSRKEYDLKCLFQMIKEDPDEPRHYYYVAQTYNCLENREKAAEYFRKRAFHPCNGFDQEKVDALFEMTRLYNFHLNYPWEECKKYYELCHEWDSERPDASYFIGIHYYLEKDYQKAYFYFKRAFEIGFPIHRQYSLKPTLSFHFLPKFFTEVCYYMNDFENGFKASKFFLEHNKPTDDRYQEIRDWYNIYHLLVNMKKPVPVPEKIDRKILCFIAPGGYKPWRGSSIIEEGVGGSETYIIEMARYIKKHSNYEVIVFCNCDSEEIFEDVKYLKLERVLTELSSYEIEHCIISRFSEYLPLAIHSHVKNIHLVVHDLSTSGIVIPMHKKLKNIFCLTNWHKKYFNQIFLNLSHVTKSFHYGIDFKSFRLDKNIPKIKNSFIYSSFPNRGLLVLLQMWPRIKSRYIDATLNVFCDMNNKWVNDNYPDEIKEINRLLQLYKNQGVANHGWVPKKRLATTWRKSEIWFYPCRFKETFCLTALEAALSKTFVITNQLAALEDTVNDRGVTVEGTEQDVLTQAWQDKAFGVLVDYMDNPDKRNTFIQANFEWATNHSWEQRAKKMLQILDIQSKEEENLFIQSKKEFIIKNTGKFYGFENDFITNYIEKHGDWEDQLNPIFQKYIDKNSVVVDIGGYIGTNTVKMGRLAKKVYVFEPVKPIFDLLVQNIKLNHLENVEYYNLGIGDTNKKVNGFWFPTKQFQEGGQNNFGAMRIDKSENLINTFYQQETDIKRLDDIIQEKIDFIKIDVEDYENNVLQGCFSLIQKYRPVIVIENHKQKDYQNIIDLGYDNFEIICCDKNTVFIPRNILNYANMYNWTNDLPKGSKVIFDNILNEIKDSTYNVLEIGTFAGTSLIAILNVLKKANGIAIDRWENYEETFEGKNIESLIQIKENHVEQIFDENVEKSNMKNRIQKIKGDSAEVLVELIKTNQRFDFIYIDGSHECPDVFLDCVLSWKLLNKNGVMVMDDYLYKKDQNDWNIPYHGINQFMKKYKDKYVILNQGYRVFLKKTKE